MLRVLRAHQQRVLGPWQLGLQQAPRAPCRPDRPQRHSGCTARYHSSKSCCWNSKASHRLLLALLIWNGSHGLDDVPVVAKGAHVMAFR